MKVFPENFLWGASTSSHQIEGGLTNDWTEWEKKNAVLLASEARKKWAPWQQEKFPEMFDPANYVSGKAANHWNRYEEDFDILKELGLNAYRFSLEWSRIEPAEGKWDEEAIAHYRTMIEALRARGITPMITLWHWPFPLWLAERGGWEASDSVALFARYTDKVVRAFGDLVTIWTTINEPEIYALNSYVRGMWPPQKKSIWSAYKVTNQLVRAHKAAYTAIKAINPKLQVGIVKDNADYEPVGWNPWNHILAGVVNYVGNHHVLEEIRDCQDFIALNFYFHNRINGKFNQNDNDKVSDMGWELYPQSLKNVLCALKQYNVPIYIAETGLADRDDTHRAWFIKGLIEAAHSAIEAGVPVKGFFYWSLLDNFEWDKGFWPRFGLVAVDFKTFARTIRPSAYTYAAIAKANGLE